MKEYIDEQGQKNTVITEDDIKNEKPEKHTPVLDRHIDLPDGIVTWKYAKDVIQSLGGDVSAVQKTWCFDEFKEAFPEFIPIFQEIVEKSQKGCRSFFASQMAECGAVDPEWAISIIETDDISDDSSKYMGSIRIQERMIQDLSEDQRNRLIAVVSDLSVRQAQRHRISPPEISEILEDEQISENTETRHTQLLPGLRLSF